MTCSFIDGIVDYSHAMRIVIGGCNTAKFLNSYSDAMLGSGSSRWCYSALQASKRVLDAGARTLGFEWINLRIPLRSESFTIQPKVFLHAKKTP